MQNQVLEALDASGCGLRIGFVWRGDRFGHSISLVQPGREPLPLLESLEGCSSDVWPTSPPLQSLSMHELSGSQRAALLVGMASRSHWSASIETAAGLPAIVFDIACRTSDVTAALQSRYRLILNSNGASVAGGRSVEFDTDAGMLRIEVAGEADLLLEGQELCVTTRGALTKPTTRWKYQLDYEVLRTEN